MMEAARYLGNPSGEGIDQRVPCAACVGCAGCGGCTACNGCDNAATNITFAGGAFAVGFVGAAVY